MSDQQMMVPQQNGAMTARQGFGETTMERKSSAATAMAARAQAEVQARYIVALQRPRNLDEFRVRLIDHCKRLGFAQAARYKKPVGGQSIEGASIRFVETALAEYGNVRAEASIVYEDDEQIDVRVTVTDLERNITHEGSATIRKRMERRRVRPGQAVLGQRMNSKGDIVYIVEATDDDVANMKAARESKLIRNAGLRILPADVVAEAMDRCIVTSREKVAQDPAGERRKLVDAFHGVGVSPAALATYLGHPLEQVQPAELVELREHYQAIRDGETTWKDIVAAKGGDDPASEGQPSAAPVPRGPVAAAKEQLKKVKAAKQAPASESSDPSTPEPMPAPAAGPQEPDPVDIEIMALDELLEHILETPDKMPLVHGRILKLPDGAEKARLLKAWTRARQALEEE